MAFSMVGNDLSSSQTMDICFLSFFISSSFRIGKETIATMAAATRTDEEKAETKLRRNARRRIARAKKADKETIATMAAATKTDEEKAET
jgi:hypothetical protein